MPTRTTYLHDENYTASFKRAFAKSPDTPFLELYVPVHFRLPLSGKHMKAIWEFEQSVVWPSVAEILLRDNVSGDFMEFGVYRGFSLRRHIEILRPLGLIGTFYGLDSFEGLPSPEEDRDHPLYVQGAFAGASVEDVMKYLAETLGVLDDVQLVKGWYRDTLPELRERISRIAFVRMDCDLYASTVDALEFLEDRLSDGAIIYFDDWTHDASTGETKALFEFSERTSGKYSFEHLLTYSDGAFAVQVHWRR